MPDQNLNWPNTTPVSPQTFRAAAALPAGGVFDPAPLEIQVANINFVTFYVTYTRAAQIQAGAVRLNIEASPYAADLPVVEDWFRLSAYEVGNVALGVDNLDSIQRTTIEYGSTGAAAEMFVYGPVELRGTVERIRIAAAESGAVANPGTCHIVGCLA